MRSAGSRDLRNGFVPPRITAAAVTALFSGLLIAVLAFSQAAASIGLAIETFRPLGGGFFSWRTGQHQLTLDIYEGRRKVAPKSLIDAGRTGLNFAPLSARSMWMVGKGFEGQERLERARRAMSRAERVTRRDAAVQLWLAEDALMRRQAIDTALRHYDTIIRTTPAASAEVLPRLAAIMAAPLGRKYLRPYVRADNPWYPSLLATAVERLPRAEPVGRLILEQGGRAVKLPQLDPVYTQLVSKLVSEGSHDVALRLYPLLPKGNNAALRSVGATVKGRPVTGYPPFVWQFGVEDAGATLVGIDGAEAGMEFYGAPGTIGVAASKLIAPGPGARLKWRIEERSANLQSSASWVATCLAGRGEGSSRSSVNLLDQAIPGGKDLSMPLPENCQAVRLDMRIAGGIGTNPAGLIVSNLDLVGTARAN